MVGDQSVKEESDPFDSFSMVNLIEGSTVLRWSKNRLTWSSGRAVNVSSTYRFQNGGDGCGQVLSALSSMSSMRRFATVTDTGDPIAVPKICWKTSPL